MVSKTAPLPDVRKMFVPTPGYILCEADLSGADARVVAWDAEDEDLMNAFDAGLKIHAKNALDLFGPGRAGPDGKKEPLYTQTKQFVHAVDYVASVQAIVDEIGWTYHEAEQAKYKWFKLHPAILTWHERIEAQLLRIGLVSNAFGYRIKYFGRLDGILPEAVAWIPQSTIARVCTKGGRQLQRAIHYKDLGRYIPSLRMLLQVHDSLIFELLPEHFHLRHLIREELQVTVPYPRPLHVPWELKTSMTSWGDTEETDWESDTYENGKLIRQKGVVYAP